MIKFFKLIVLTFFIVSLSNISSSNESFFVDGVKLFKIKKYKEAKFLFERKIVQDPKHSDSYLYLAKI